MALAARNAERLKAAAAGLGEAGLTAQAFPCGLGDPDAVRALAAHPLVRSVNLAERLYAEMAVAHRQHLPARLAPA